jgi:hypothetical protein
MNGALPINFDPLKYISRKHLTACMRIQATAISIKVVPEQTGKVEYERERLLGIAKKFIKPFALVFYFSALLGDNLN